MGGVYFFGEPAVLALARFSGRHYRWRRAIKLRGKSSQTQANYTEMDEPANIGDESNDSEDEQAEQKSQKPIALG
jgi:hypothetical protein